MIIIDGVTESGGKFRPSAWAEMLIEGVGLAHFGADHKIHYLPLIEPATINGNAAIIIDESLEEIRPEAFAEIMRFAAENRLQVRHEEGSIADRRVQQPTRRHYQTQRRHT
ncbi:conserved protein of unknown function [Acidithiobacillus ferrivorans]|jgi:hypothetical protein|uniref:DUF3579 domain-containing protein n=1 Tax=Acidithiobacillus ferrivorans TaxID=160808 RepID=A0A060USI2_9PROT|nr:DUF3579 domain-containing protein [Acidithiobacillus ferrivorans]MBN6741771.1 DUF3579 domain-containing protein [Acidithiobacillus sp. MC6.1]MBU2849674.1 DUF3579 domain-containing protein [Acidithiobacillus ferrivorans]OCB02558.1 hypothetical protein BBC27_12555 [Acidithiobacillus ferrivorans]QQD72184.1 DUF3579 domain-containing protein [Acidithiobacillus ferrivorans]CDQ09479.1 conserved hypothetical protein [Acidithiobacillus ferrivorans]